MLIQKNPDYYITKNMSENIFNRGVHLPYLLASKTGGKIYYINRKEAYIWNLIYRPHEYNELKVKFYRKFPEARSNYVRIILHKWKRQGLIDNNNKINKKRSEIVFLNSNEISEKIYKSLGFLTNIKLALVLVTLSILIITGAMILTFPQHNSLSGTNFLAAFTITIFSLISHEVGHILFAKKYGVDIYRVGFKFYYLIPIFFVDTSGVWSRPKKERIITSFGGIYINILLAGLGSIILILSSNVSVILVAKSFVWFNIVSTFANLYPFVKFDGYFIMIDLLNRPLLIEKSNHSLSNFDFSNIGLKILGLIHALSIFILSAIAITSWILLFN